MNNVDPFRIFSIVICLFMLISSPASLAQQTPKSPQDYVPPELQASNPEVKAYLDAAEKLGQEGNYAEGFLQLQKALDLCSRKGLLADKALLEAKLGGAYFVRGKLDEAKEHWLTSFSDAIKTANLVLQADTLVALSSMAQASGNLVEALDLGTKALDIARKSKSFWIQSRALGELGRLQLILGKVAEARNSVEEALRIDRLNQYTWEASHLLYLAWITASDTSKLDQAIQFASSARDLATKHEDYIVFMQASESLGQAYANKGELTKAIALLEHSRDGVSDEGKPMFLRPGSYRAAISLPYLGVTFLEAMAMVYQRAGRTDDAIKSWGELYEVAKKADFKLAVAEAAHGMADLYRMKEEFSQAISYYSLAAQAWPMSGNTQRQIDALESESFLLFQQGKVDKSIQIDEELLPLVRSSKNVRQHFIINLAIAEKLQPNGDLDRAAKALQEAESLLSIDLTAAGVEPKLVLEMYLRLADLHGKNNSQLQEVVALEKAMTPAEAIDVQAMKSVDAAVNDKLGAMHARDLATKAYENGDLETALLYLELLEHFEQTDARWNGKSSEYQQSLDNSQIVNRIFEIPFKLVTQPGGATFLEGNLQHMGPIAQMARFPILKALVDRYMVMGNPEMVVKFATLALPQLHLGKADQPIPWDVQLACQLAYSLLLQKDVDSAVQRVGPCLLSAQKLGDRQLLALAHQTNVWVLQAAGRQDEAQESVRFLMQHVPDDPLHYIELAQLKAKQGASAAAAEAWRQALHLYEIRKDLKGMASTQLSLAMAVSSATADNEEERALLQSALALFKQLGNFEGQAWASYFLGKYFAANKNNDQARGYFDAALSLSRRAKSPHLEASILSEAGNVYRGAGDPARALDSYRKAAEIYQSLNDTASEATQVQNQAEALNELHKTEEALQTYLKAKRLADDSGSWLPRYWVRRLLAIFYETRGNYENALSDLQAARTIANTAHQPLNSAWASLAFGQMLATVGAREDAVDALNLALPIFRESKDVENEGAVYLQFMEIYGARESELKDFDKALEYYQSARQLAAKYDPARAVALNLDAVEIYWQQKRFKEANALSNEALTYYQKQKSDWGQASSLLSLAEIQRSSGDVQGAAGSMKRAESFMKHMDDFYMIGRFHYGMANQRRSEARYQEAIDEYEGVIAMLEQVKSTTDTNLRRKVSNTYGYIYDELIDTYYRLGEQQPLLKLAEADHALQQAELNKSRVFTTSWGRTFIEALKRELPALLSEKERTLSARQNDLQSELEQAQLGQGVRSIKQVQQDLKQQAAEFDALAKELRKVTPAYAEARFPEKAGLASLPLRPGEIFVELKMLEDALLVWMVEGTETGPRLISFYKVEHTHAWFDERILSLRSAFNRAAPDLFDPQIAEDLFDALFPTALAAHLTSAKAVIFVPDDIFFLLPFELLSPQASHSQFVLLKMPTSYFPSAAALRLSRALAPAKHEWQAQFFGMADPITSADDERYAAAGILSDVESMKPQAPAHGLEPPVRGPLSDDLKTRDYFFSRLPDTAIEVKNIAALFPTDSSSTMVRTGMDARKRELLQTDLGKFRFIHFATHGFVPVEPGMREPALILSYDGKDEGRMMLTLSEILQLKLHAEMVVLSACNTGSGKVTRAEGVASLGTAFLAAGASSTAMSLWKVSDKSTAILMEEFYRNLLKGMPKSAALAAARSALVSKGFANPFYWAPFILTGE